MSIAATAERDRLSLRIAPDNKRKVEEAAGLRGQTLTDFVVGVLVDRAEEVIRKHRTWRLTEKDFEAFVAAIDSPPQPTAALVDLFREGLRQEEAPEAPV